MPVYYDDPRLRFSQSACGTGSSDVTPRPTLVSARQSTFAAKKTPPNPITIFPRQRRFAVVQMDPVGMLKAAGLDSDSMALAQAYALNTKKYLVYFEAALDLPMPRSEWCRYRANPVASTVRAEYPQWGITSDMVLPIHPNVDHLVVPNPFVDEKDPEHTFKFPFKNCFFWVHGETELRIRVRRGDDGYDDRKAIALELRPHLRLMGSFKPHICRISRHLARTRGTPRVPMHPPTAASDGIPTMPPDANYDASKDLLPFLLPAGDLPCGRPECDVTDSKPSSTSESEPSLTLSPVEEILSLDLFGWQPSLATKYIPLVDCWFELEEHLSESTIPSPVGLWTEQQRIGAIINDAIVRRNVARVAIKPRPVLAPLETHSTTTSKSPGKIAPWKVLSGIVSAGMDSLAKALQSEPGRSAEASQPPPRRTKVASPTASGFEYRSRHPRTQKKS